MLQSLEDYIVEMENRSAIPKPSPNSDINDDLWAQLQQKENDLVLAAELGKALLSSNEELKKKYENVVDEYQKKLEVSFHILSAICAYFNQIFRKILRLY